MSARTIGPPPARAPQLLLQVLERDRRVLHPLGRQALARVAHAKEAAAAPTPPKASGALRAPMSSAWHMGGYPKSKTTPPGHPGQAAHAMPAAKPPSNRAFHEDMDKSINDPARGARLGVPPR